MLRIALRRARAVLFLSLLSATPAFAQYDSAFFNLPGFMGGNIEIDLGGSTWGNFSSFGWNDQTASVSFRPGVWARLFQHNNLGGSSVMLIGDVNDLHWFYPMFSQYLASSYQIGEYSTDTPGNLPVLFKNTNYTLSNGGGLVLIPNLGWDGIVGIYQFDYYWPQSFKAGGGYYKVVIENQLGYGYQFDVDVPDLSVYMGPCSQATWWNCPYKATIYVED